MHRCGLSLSVLFAIFLFSSPAWGRVNFDGTDDFIEVLSGVSISGSTQASISVWVITDNLNDLNYVIYQEPRDPNVAQSRFTLDINGTTNRFRLGGRAPDSDSFTEWVNSTLVLSTDTWYHVVGVFNSVSDQHQIYINGARETRGSVSDAFTGGDPVEADIGRRADGAAFWNGRINELAIWNIALTQTEVDLLGSKVKRMPCQIRPSNLLIYLPMDDVADGTSADGATFNDPCGDLNGTGDDGANNTGLTGLAEEVLTYP